MAGTINYLYDAGQTVHVIDNCIDPNNKSETVPVVRPGKVIRVRVALLITTATPEPIYDIQVGSQSGTTEFVETDVFTDLATAITEYQLRLS